MEKCATGSAHVPKSCTDTGKTSNLYSCRVRCMRTSVEKGPEELGAGDRGSPVVATPERACTYEKDKLAAAACEFYNKILQAPKTCRGKCRRLAAAI